MFIHRLKNQWVREKNLRGFEYAEEYDKKCHLCGEREGWIKAGVGDLKVGRYIGDSEVLCTICFVKRALGDHYLKEKFKNTSNNPFQNYSFPSTAEIATSDFKLMCLEKAGDDLKAYFEPFKGGGGGTEGRTPPPTTQKKKKQYPMIFKKK